MVQAKDIRRIEVLEQKESGRTVQLDGIRRIRKRRNYRERPIFVTDNHYQIDFFLSEADTLIAQDKVRITICSHDAYGIDTVRNPLWSVFWEVDKHDQIVAKFRRLGFKTGDFVSINIDTGEKPSVCRL